MKRLKMSKTVEDLRNFYDEVASCSGSNWQESMYRTHEQQERFHKTLEYISNSANGGKALELGSANGKMTTYISKMFDSVDAVEISSIAIDNSPEIENVTYICADATEFLENTDEHYDMIIATEVLEHVLDFEKTFRLCQKRGDLIVVSMPISEEINESGAFDSSLIGREKNAGDATGHLRIITPEELMSYFKDVIFTWNNGISVIVAGY
jgi:2-polyprenyl-3-methyl-5-hydroxy-6-metoxy-1,4-benzoquinol methylase